MARETSIKCYNQIKSEGLLSKRRLQVYEALLDSAPCTSSEAIRNSGATFGVFGVSSRFTELRDLGVIYEKGTKICSVTNRNVIEWDLTDKLPKDLPKIKTQSKKDIKKEAIALIVTIGSSPDVSEEIKQKLRDLYKLVVKL
jgi:hypothetical protein